jgi:hypothetical protein
MRIAMSRHSPASAGCTILLPSTLLLPTQDTLTDNHWCQKSPRLWAMFHMPLHGMYCMQPAAAHPDGTHPQSTPTANGHF